MTRTPMQRLPHVETLALLAIAALLVVGMFCTRSHIPARVETQAVRVEAGDTLWSLASRHGQRGFTTAQVADLIARENRVADAMIVPGQTLLVPATDANPQYALR